MARLSSLILISSLLVGLSPLSAVIVAPDETMDLVTTLEKVGAMKTEGLPRAQANALQRYYEESFGGAENWQRVQSMRFEGKLHLADGPSLDFYAYLKKPNLCKIVVSVPGTERKIIMGYDGTDVWQSIPGESGPQIGPMPKGEAANFIRDAWFGGHLLYPDLPGKTIETLETTQKAGEQWMNLKVTTPEGPSVIYSIVIGEYLERQRSMVNQVNGETEVVTQSDFRDISGIQVPFSSILTSNGNLVHKMLLSRVDVNRGVMPWMFQRP